MISAARPSCFFSWEWMASSRITQALVQPPLKRSASGERSAAHASGSSRATVSTTVPETPMVLGFRQST